MKTSLGRRRLLSGRVVGREDGLLGLLADVHLEVARDSLLLGHCGGCAGLCMRECGGLCQASAEQSSVSARGNNGLVVVEVTRVEAAGELARKDYARRGRMQPQSSSGQREAIPE